MHRSSYYYLHHLFSYQAKLVLFYYLLAHTCLCLCAKIGLPLWKSHHEPIKSLVFMLLEDCSEQCQ